MIKRLFYIEKKVKFIVLYLVENIENITIEKSLIIKRKKKVDYYYLINAGDSIYILLVNVRFKQADISKIFFKYSSE